jgi:hypothetical protein
VLQGKLRVAIVSVESHAAVVAERDAHITLAMTQLERALKKKAASSLVVA